MLQEYAISPNPHHDHDHGDLDIARVLASVSAGVALLRGPSHVFEAHNDLYRQLVGFDRELAGRPVADALPEVVDQGFIALLDRVYGDGEPFIGREVAIDLDRGPGAGHEQAYVDFAYIPVRDARGAIDGILVHAIEVTELVLAREQSKELADEVAVERGRLLEIIEQLQVGVALADAEGQLLIANKGWRDTFEIPAEQVADLDDIQSYEVFEGYWPDGRPYKPEEYPISRALLHDEVVDAERILWRYSGGRERTVDVRATRIRAVDGTPVTAMVATVDVTRLALERQLAGQQAAAEQRAAEREEQRAFELNDTIVQRLAVAELAFSLGQEEQGRAAVHDAMETAKRLINEWAVQTTDLGLPGAAGG